MPDPVPQVHTETFNLHLEFQWDGGTLEEFETNFRSFQWNTPKFVHFSEPMSGFGAKLTMNAFETQISDRAGPLVNVMAGGIAHLHGNGELDLGAEGTIDFRAVRLERASIYLGVTGSVTANPAGGHASVEFGPSLTIRFGGAAGGN